MRDDLFEADAFDRYADRIRRGETDVYAAFRIFDRHWSLRCADRRHLMRKAALLLIDDDPWFLATSFATFLRECLTRRDIERLTPRVGAGLPAGAAAYLRAKLWFHAIVPSRRDKTATRQTLAFLRKVPRQYRRLGWLDMTAGCHQRSGNWREYTRVFPRLLEATESDWQSSPLRTMLENAARQRDWRTYDRWRRAWDKLPPTRHQCECYKNAVATLDGIRAFAARRWDEIPQHLATASDVTGCAHLNTGGFRMDLVQLLVRRRKHLDACRAYLERAARFSETKQLVTLRRALQAHSVATNR